MILYFFYHGKIPFFTTIWENIFWVTFSRHQIHANPRPRFFLFSFAGGKKCRKRRNIWRREDELIVASGDWHLKVLKGEPKLSDHYHYHGSSKNGWVYQPTPPGHVKKHFQKFFFGRIFLRALIYFPFGFLRGVALRVE